MRLHRRFFQSRRWFLWNDVVKWKRNGAHESVSPFVHLLNTDHAQKKNNHTKLAICRWLCALRTQFISHTCTLIMVYICFYASVLVPNWRSFNVIFDRILGCHFQLWLLATRVTTQIELIAWCFDMLKTTKFGEALGTNVISLEVKCITRKTIFLDLFTANNAPI